MAKETTNVKNAARISNNNVQPVKKPTKRPKTKRSSKSSKDSRKYANKAGS